MVSSAATSGSAATTSVAIILVIGNLFTTSLLATGTMGGTFAAATHQYSHKDIEVTQSKTGEKVNGEPEYEVDVFNSSPCTQSNITMYCQGFQTWEKVDPNILKKIGNGSLCLVFQGRPILAFQGKGVSFMYAWPKPFPFRTVSSNVFDCT